jgi:hypothetical protein
MISPISRTDRRGCLRWKLTNCRRNMARRELISWFAPQAVANVIILYYIRAGLCDATVYVQIDGKYHRVVGVFLSMQYLARVFMRAVIPPLPVFIHYQTSSSEFYSLENSILLFQRHSKILQYICRPIGTVSTLNKRGIRLNLRLYMLIEWSYEMNDERCLPALPLQPCPWKRHLSMFCGVLLLYVMFVVCHACCYFLNANALPWILPCLTFRMQ